MRYLNKKEGAKKNILIQMCWYIDLVNKSHEKTEPGMWSKARCKKLIKMYGKRTWKQLCVFSLQEEEK